MNNQELNSIENTVGKDGKIDEDSLRQFLNSRVLRYDYFAIMQSFKDLPWVAPFFPLLIFLIFVLYYFINKLSVQEEGNFALSIVFFAACLLAIFTIIFLSLLLVSYSMKQKNTDLLDQAENEVIKLIYEKRNEACEKCSSLNLNETLNSYNLYTYDQILQIEQSVYGKNATVFCYSRYRDDGEEVGIPEAEKIVSENLARGVNYYCVYYEENPKSTKSVYSKSNSDSIKQKNIEHFIELSQKLGRDYIEECLDYRVYRDARFDVMIYYWNKNRIEGYYSLSFPTETMCLNCDNATRQSCHFYGNADDPSKIIYKKMPQNITTELYNRLRSIVDSELQK